ncbi:glutathione S-transferase [Oceanicola sp. 22II-s10i]|uniref:glutathione S-transferase family protein n=1 Tax=Oceanicola sp. 22II-s10i TaxID=1317116 RepID=UPI000B526142|nr:glutathione S-transferase family protein [Oceanicola sp. 22II-s10i]OWU82358.1 glutathione S-transferase [Oceanicola sp. 22II-s10i]
MIAYRLHYFPESGNSYKLALMLRLCGQPFEGIWTDFGGGVTRTPEWRRAVNEMGEIPVLEEDGVKTTQTALILRRLAARYGQYGGSDPEEVLRWLIWDNQKLSGQMATYRFLRTYTKDADPAVLTFLRWRVDDCLRIAEARLADRAFVMGDEPTIADISMCAYLSFPEDETGYRLADSHPAVQAWLGRIAALPGWKSPYDLLPGERLPRYDR